MVVLVPVLSIVSKTLYQNPLDSLKIFIFGAVDIAIIVAKTLFYRLCQ